MAEKLTTEDVEELLETSNRQIREESATFHRYLFDEIDWRDRLICIKGARGTGKTTLMRQRMKEHFGEDSGKAIYASLDDLWFAYHRLKDFAEYAYEHGYTHLFLDEVQHLGKDWSLAVKNIADQFRKLNIVYSGSSLLQLEKAAGDLSRRQATYTLEGMSFREYLGLEGVLEHRALTMEEIVTDHVGIASKIDKGLKVLPFFETYRKCGFYPFYRESLAKFGERLAETVNKVLEVDYPAIDEVSQETIRKTRRMLMVLAASCPQTPNMSGLYRELETGRDQGLKMLKALHRAGLLALLDAKGMKLNDLSKPEKIYVSNTNLMRAIVPRVDVGVERETFFYSQVRKGHAVAHTGVGDFVVDGRWTFEVGGKGKGFAQIADIPRSYVVNDEISVGHGCKIPLWLYGFLY
ncbi:MAG: ATP-binding protein [Kiritimatiellae bacterium]|nr:ATP-binding protein [Kiritimatiellia bacterium]